MFLPSDFSESDFNFAVFCPRGAPHYGPDGWQIQGLLLIKVRLKRLGDLVHLVA